MFHHYKNKTKIKKIEEKKIVKNSKNLSLNTMKSRTRPNIFLKFYTLNVFLMFQETEIIYIGTWFFIAQNLT